jgi:hypothetical protein
MATLQDAFDRMTNLPMFEAERPATAQEIHQIEAELGVTLPVQYVQFLRQYGYAAWFGKQIVGILPIDRITGQRSTVTSDCVSVTKKARQPNNRFGTANLPLEHVIIGTDGAGGYYVLFTAGSTQEGEVHYYNFEDQTDPLQVWKTLQDYLEYEIHEATRK